MSARDGSALVAAELQALRGDVAAVRAEQTEQRRENSEQHREGRQALEAAILRVHGRIDEAVRELEANRRAGDAELWRAVGGLRSRWWGIAAGVVVLLLGVAAGLLGLVGWLLVNGAPWHAGELARLLPWLA